MTSPNGKARPHGHFQSGSKREVTPATDEGIIERT
jgi:hypothetical protein